MGLGSEEGSGEKQEHDDTREDHGLEANERNVQKKQQQIQPHNQQHRQEPPASTSPAAWPPSMPTEHEDKQGVSGEGCPDVGRKNRLDGSCRKDEGLDHWGLMVGKALDIEQDVSACERAGISAGRLCSSFVGWGRNGDVDTLLGRGERGYVRRTRSPRIG